MSADKQNAMRILSEFDVDNLGGSFKVTLVDSVRCSYDIKLEKERVDIPDEDGLINTIATVRAIHQRKLSGPDIKFLRKHLGLRSKELADHLDVTPEHLSRCENGDKTLSANSEKLLRLLVLMKPFQILQKLIEDTDNNKQKYVKSLVIYGKLISDLVSRMKILAVSNDDEPLVFRFRYVKVEPVLESEAANDDDGSWDHPSLPRSLAA